MMLYFVEKCRTQKTSHSHNSEEKDVSIYYRLNRTRDLLAGKSILKAAISYLCSKKNILCIEKGYTFHSSGKTSS